MRSRHEGLNNLSKIFGPSGRMNPTQAKDTSKKTGSLLVRGTGFLYPNGSFCRWIKFCLVERGRMLLRLGRGRRMSYAVQVALQV